MKHIEGLTYEMIEEARKTLGLFDIVTAQEVKLAYRKLAKEHHPDRSYLGIYDDGKFKKVSEAYRVLMSFISQYNYSLREEDVKKQLLGTMDDFFNRFNDSDSAESRGKHKFKGRI